MRHKSTVGRFVVAFLVALTSVQLQAQTTDEERFEAARRRLEERQRAATQAAVTRPATSPAAAAIGPSFEQLVGQTAKELNQILQETPLLSLTTIQKQRWDESQAGRREEAKRQIVGKSFETALTIVDVRPGNDVMATIPADLPEHVSRTFRDRLAGIAKSYEERIVAQSAKMRATTSTTLKKMYADQVDAEKLERDKAMNAERLRQSTIKQEVEIRVAGVSQAEVTGLSKGAKLRKKFVVRSFEVVETIQIGRGRDRTEVSPGPILIDVEVEGGQVAVAAASPATGPASKPAAPVAAVIAFPNLDEEVRAAADMALTPAALAEPPVGLTTVQAIRWREEQQGKRDAQRRVLVGKMFNAVLTVEDVIPVENSKLQHDEVQVIRAVTDAKTAVVASLSLPIKSSGLPPTARIVLVADDERYAAKGKGEQITASVEVLLADSTVPPKSRRVAPQEAYRVVAFGPAPKPVLPPSNRVVFLLDATGSMVNKVGTAKHLILKAVAELPEKTMMNLVVTTNGGKAVAFQTAMTPAGPATTRSLQNFLDPLQASGTDGKFEGALTAISRLRPETVWFYTDGEFNEGAQALTVLLAAARRDGYRINVVLSETYDKQAAETVSLLAESTGGTCIDSAGRAYRSKARNATGSKMFKDR